MIDREIASRLERIAGVGKFSINESMAKHTTFRCGGKCDYFASPSENWQVAEIIEVCREAGIPFCILGNGSNLLVSDKGYHGVMIHMGGSMSGFTVDEDQGIVSVKAGTMLAGMSKQVSRMGLADMTFASGIPGSFGGACVMNAGAYGGEMKQVLKDVTWLSEDGRIVTTPADELGLGYRESIFKHSDKVILSGSLQLSRQDPRPLMERIEELTRQRKEKQPLEYPSAGSTFKRPAGYFAGKLIQDSGLRGYQLGGAQVSEKHCGFVINKDHATATELYQLFCYIQDTVKERFGVELELEVQLAGEF